MELKIDFGQLAMVITALAGLAGALTPLVKLWRGRS
jgi:hypothetical protein